jgi:hypothetical protein
MSPDRQHDAQFSSLVTCFNIAPLFEAVAESTTVGLCICDVELRYQFINATLARMNGLPRDVHIGKLPSDVLGDAGRAIESKTRDVIETGRPMRNVEFIVTVPATLEIQRRVSSYFQLTDSGGHPSGAIALVVQKQFTDIKGAKITLTANPGTVPVVPETHLHSSPPPTAHDDTLLRSWKDVAKFLAASVSTVQRWEREHKLPIHRITHEKGSVILARPAELQQWLSKTAHLLD